MPLLQSWRQAIPASVGDAVASAQNGASVDFTYGLLATAILWPVRQAVLDFDTEAVAAMHEATPGARLVLKAMQGWEDDRLAAGRALAAAAANDADLRQAVHDLLAFFDATRMVQEALAARFRAVSPAVIEQIEAAIVNIGGVMSIDQLNLTLAAPDIPPPAPPDAPPAIPGFTGRESELAYFREKLQQNHLALIVGMAGVGKTALAVALVRGLAPTERIFWHSFHEGESVPVLIWELANFLAWHGEDELWTVLQRAQQAGGQPPPAHTLFNYVIETLRGRGYLLCLDDFQYVDDDPILELLVEQLRDLMIAGELDIVITARHKPGFTRFLQAQFEPLEGLSPADARRFLAARGIALDEHDITSLHQYTGGNAAFLTLAANALGGSGGPQQLLARLAETGDVADFLMDEVHDQLEADEQMVMAAVAILLDYPGTREAVEAVLGGASIWRPLQNLVQKNLLLVHEGAADSSYSQHAIVRNFYYSTLGRAQRRQMHQRAAVFYEQVTPEPLRAALHYQAASEHAQAAAILTADLWYFVNHGQSRALQQLLAQLDIEQLEPATAAQVQLTSGRVLHLLEEPEVARAQLEKVLAAADTLADRDAARQLVARACLAMAELVYHNVPQEALGWLEKGLAELDEEDELAGALLIKKGEVHMNQGGAGDAVAALEKGLGLLPQQSSQLRAEALMNLGGVYFLQGDVARALHTTDRALALSRRLKDHFLTVKILSNSGFQKFTAGSWAEAVATWEEALELAVHLGSDEQRMFIEGNLGIAFTYIGDYEAAQNYLSLNLQRAEKHDARYLMMVSQFHLAELELRMRSRAKARELAELAGRLAEELEAVANQAEIDALWAEILLAEERLPEAQARAEATLQTVRRLEMSLEEGRVLRTLAQTEAALGQSGPAREHFAASYDLLNRADPYEAARTEVQWALLLRAEGSEAEAVERLDAARAFFRRVGARRDLDYLDTIAAAATPAAEE